MCNENHSTSCRLQGVEGTEEREVMGTEERAVTGTEEREVTGTEEREVTLKQGLQLR